MHPSQDLTTLYVHAYLQCIVLVSAIASITFRCFTQLLLSTEENLV